MSPEGCIFNKKTIYDRTSEEDQGWEEETKHGVGMEDTGFRSSRKKAQELGVLQKGGCWAKPGVNSRRVQRRHHYTMMLGPGQAEDVQRGGERCCRKGSYHCVFSLTISLSSQGVDANVEGKDTGEEN